jgi:Nucleotidyltransferase
VTILAPDLEDFGRLVDALTPWLDQVVIIGGWAHRLYRFHPLAQRLGYPPLMTLDADVALPPGLRVKGPDIHERLIANGFQAEFLGHHQPPATHYRLSVESSSFYAEFLSPLVGNTHTRSGKAKATTRIAGVVSQRLRHLDLVLVAPWTVKLSASEGFPFADAKHVLIANPVSFLAQKALIHKKRKRSERAKDILYIHDTLETLGARIGDLRRMGLHSQAETPCYERAIR